ncbi:MAG: MoaF N-terminal domain-containing protein [Ideonella sp.]|nr:MoaF N-terminal domain-containing protein [Ideonella sp.]MCC7458703.1 MoaF N-terminal domain-containing protein [Nitrospira sp.]
MTQTRPADWKNYDDFAAGIATNRLPASDALVGRVLRVNLPALTLTLRPSARHQLQWQESGERNGSGTDWYEAIEVAADTWFIDITQASRPREALTLIVNTRSLRVLAIRCRVIDADEAKGEPRVPQQFLVGTLGDDPAAASGMVPHVTRDLIGLRTHQTYSPNHTYEHTYLNSQRYAWQCLVGVQRGQGDVDLASYWQFDTDQYIFTFREFLIPVASVFFFNFASGRSTGKFLGVTGDGAIANNPAGAFMRKVSMTFYPADATPI